MLNPYHNIQHHLRNPAETVLIDYSSESLLQYTREGNFKIVKEILHQSAIGSIASDLLRPGASDDITNLKKVKIDLEIQDEVKQTPLLLATRYNFYEIACLLIENGAKVNCADMDLWTPLLNATKSGNLKLVETLIDHKAFMEDRDTGGFTALIWACYKNHVDIVKVLLRNSANPNAQCKNGICCLSWAAGRGYHEIVEELLRCPSIKVNLHDQNNSTPVLWAARKGSLKIVEELIENGANPDIIGMNSMTPLIISCKNGHLDVALYLSKLPNLNLNHVDKDGNSALSIAAKNGYIQVTLSLLERNAYINKPNKKGDSILITAVKGGHKEIVDALLAKHVEIDAIGNQGKTAMHHAVDKGNLELVRSLLVYKPDLDIVSKDGDTVLLLATKKKNATIVNELLNSGSRVSPTDRNGDNVLHISLRNRSREITELILANPKNSKYLYKPNKTGETPHKIDASNPKSILTQIFGARQLNMTEDTILGYDLYSSALAEILSEPSLHTPITVGLYAKWGSGKSFLLSQLKSEMKSFARLTNVVNLKIDVFLILTVFILSFFIGLPFIFKEWYYGLVVLGIINILTFITIFLCKYFYEKREKDWAERACFKISNQITRFKLMLRILFMNPFTYKQESVEHKNLRFIFTEYGKISTIGGENALALMIASLYQKMEDQLGVVITRLCRVFYHKSHSHSKYKRVCCIPSFLIAIMVILLMLSIVIFFRVKGFDVSQFKANETAILITLAVIILLSIVGSIFTWSKILWNIMRSPSSHIMNAAQSKDKNRFTNDPKTESFILKLKREVDLISHTIRTIDAFTHSCTRIVIILDGLDSCEQAKVLQILEIVHILFTKEGDPFACVLAVDPHVLIKGLENNSGVFRNGNVNGHDYLRTIIHLPVYLQVDLTKAKALSKTTNNHVLKKNNYSISSSQDMISKLSSDLSGNKKKDKRRKNVSKPMSAYDLTDQLIKSDYFLDVNPLNLRRLINIIALTGRLLRAYHIDFNWRLLASWIYLNEQWPYRCSWMVLYYEEHENEFPDDTTINEIYERVKSLIPNTNEPLLELDRNARKFEQYVESCEPKLTVSIFKKIVPCTCNMDPYLIKLIKDSIEAHQDKHPQLQMLNPTPNLIGFNSYADFINQNSITPYSFSHLPTSTSNNKSFNLQNLFVNNTANGSTGKNLSTTDTMASFNKPLKLERNENAIGQSSANESMLNRTSDNHDNSNTFKLDMSKSLDEMSLIDVCEAINTNSVEYMSDEFKQIYVSNIKEKNINGRVLTFCDLEELKVELKMTFGDWQLFKNWIIQKRLSQTEKKLNELNKPNKPLAPIKSYPIYETQSSNSNRNSQDKNGYLTPRSSTTQLSTTTSPTARKVEFFVTPVIEISNSDTEKEKEDYKEKNNSDNSSLHPLLTKQPSIDQDVGIVNNSLSDDPSFHNHNLDQIFRNLANNSISDNDKTEILPLFSSKQNLQDNVSISSGNSVTKIGKKFFKSIDNLFHKQNSNEKKKSVTINTNTMNSDAEENKHGNTNTLAVDEDYDDNSSYYDDDNTSRRYDSRDDGGNTTDNAEATVQPKKNNTKKESIKMKNIKRSLSKAKRSITSSFSESSSKSHQKNANKTDQNNKQENEENDKDVNKTKTTYYIFDDEDEIY